jgi:hypothetical protein
MADILHRKFYALVADPNAKNLFPASFEDAQDPVNPPGSANTGIVGPGTLNRLAKFTSANTIGDSVFFEDSVDFGVIRTTGSFKFPDSGANRRGIEGRVSANDFWYIGGGQMPGGITDRGFLEIATGDNGTEPIFVRQYLGVPTASSPTVVNEIQLLDASGNSRFPGTMRIDTINNLGTAATNVIVTDALGVLHSRTISEMPYVRYDINTQGLDATQRQNARTNIQALSRDTNDSRTGTLTNTGQVNIAGKLITTDEAAGTSFQITKLGVSGSNFFLRFLNDSGVAFSIATRGDTRITRNLVVVPAVSSAVTIRDTGDTTDAVILRSNGTILQSRSSAVSDSTRRDELPFNYPQTVGTSGIIDNLAINEDTKLLEFTNADELTGVVPSTANTGRLLRLFARGTTLIVRNESTGSSGANRFAIGTDLTINDGEIYSFIYTNGKWRLLTSPNSVRLVSSSVKFTSTNVYTTVFGTGENITSGALNTFDITKIGLRDVIEIEITFNNYTTNTDKIGILRFSLDGGTNQFLEIGKTGTDPYSGKFTIKIIYLGADAYAVYGNIYINEGELQASNRSVFFTQTITTNWDFVADFLSGVDGSSDYGGRTDFLTEVYYRKSTNGPFA